MKIPQKFNEILIRDEKLHSSVLQVISDFQPILKDNKLYFFEEYTDHGIEHIESVLNASAEIITDESFELLTAKDICILILSTILHDLGMHIEYSTFLAFLNGEYDHVRIESLDKKTWKQLWEEYLNEAKRFSSKQRYLYFGNENQPFREPNLMDKDSLDGADKKLIGEFVRRFHTRFAHEVALKGLVGKDREVIEFGGNRLDALYKKLAGMVARSHGMNIRDTFPYLREISGDAWKNPSEVNITFLMVVLRIADYFQFHKGRVDSMLLKLKTFKSPVSKTEHDKHLAIEFVQTHFDDIERLYVYAKPENSEIFVKLADLLRDIQYELDMSWAVLGEIYSRSPIEKQPKIKYRRITSNLEDESYYSKLSYVPEKISFQSDVELPKLLIAPLYGNNPTYGVRELIQNAVDACLEREFEEKKNSNDYTPEVKLEINKLNNEAYEFIIQDNGKGMSLYEIRNYFLRVGSSFRKSLDWKKTFTNEQGNSLLNRNGRFGIGVLAAFLLGSVIDVSTKNYKEEYGYSFITNVDTDQIEIKIDKKIDNGTKIKINISENVYISLVNSLGISKGVPSWENWFLLNKPSVIYRVNGDEIRHSKLIDLCSQNWHIFKPDNYKSVAWRYERKDNISYNSQNYDFIGKLVCNGIVIPDFKDAFSRTSTYGSLIRETPVLVVEDTEGYLPLSLNRNKLDGDLPFLNELVEDLSKDFIASILCLDIDISKNLQKRFNLNPNLAQVAYLREGFTFLINKFLKILNSSGYRFIKLLVSDDEMPFTYSFLETKHVLIPETYHKIKMTYAETQSFPRGGRHGRMSLSKEMYEKLIDPSKNRTSKTFLYIHKKELDNGKVVVIDIDFNREFNRPQSKLFRKILDKSFENVESIQEVEFDESYLEAENVVSDLLEKYIGENVVIPYDLEKRKEIYPLAFKELKDYMKKYQNDIKSMGDYPISLFEDVYVRKYHQDFDKDYYQDFDDDLFDDDIHF